MKDLQKKAYLTVADLLKKNSASISAAMPKHMSIDRLSRIALSELRTTPALLNCEPTSLMNSITKAAHLGLEVGGALGHAYLVPFQTEATLIIGYRGLISLARRSGEILSISAQCARENDVFEFEYGLHERLRHIPAIGSRGDITHAYAIARLKDGGLQYDVMTKADIDAIRKRSRAGGSGPWVTDYEEMARKTVVRRLFKYLPVSIELAEAVANDERTDTIEKDITPAQDLTEKILQSAPEQTETKPDILVDNNGEQWNPEHHATGKDGHPVYNADGTFRARRKPKKQPVKVEENPGPQVTVEQLEKLIDDANNVDMLDEILDLAVYLPVEAATHIVEAVGVKRREIGNDK